MFGCWFRWRWCHPKLGFPIEGIERCLDCGKTFPSKIFGRTAKEEYDLAKRYMLDPGGHE